MLTTTFDEFLATGGVTGRERAAAEQAIAAERAFWLPILEGWAASLSTEESDLYALVYLDGEIRRLRRLLRLPAAPSAEASARRREQTRERVRRFRERQRLKAAQ